MKLKHFCIFSCTTILLLSGCAGLKVDFDRIEYFHGNTSLPPPYQETFYVKVDSVDGLVKKKIGGEETSAEFEVQKNDFRKLQQYCKKLVPQDKQLGQYADGGAISVITLSKGDSVVYTINYQEQHNVGKNTHKLTEKLEEMAPKMRLNLKGEGDQYGGGSEE